DAVAQRTVHHDDSAAGGSFEVDIVDTNARASDNLERGCVVDDVARHLGAAANHQRIVGPDYRRQFGGLKAGLEVELELWMALQDFDALRRKWVAQKDAEGFRHVRFKCSVRFVIGPR